jgi:hypothetical protein
MDHSSEFATFQALHGSFPCRTRDGFAVHVAQSPFFLVHKQGKRTIRGRTTSMNHQYRRSIGVKDKEHDDLCDEYQHDGSVKRLKSDASAAAMARFGQGWCAYFDLILQNLNISSHYSWHLDCS